MDLETAYETAWNRFDGSNFDALSEQDRILVTIWGLEADVNNGGFDQYFFNSSGDQAFFAEEALRRIGANTMADIVAKAVSIFGTGGPPRNWNERQDALESLRDENEDLLEELNGQFYAYPDDISALVESFLAITDSAG